MRTVLNVITWTLRLLSKIVLLPVIITLTIFKFVCIVAVSVASTVFNLIGGILIISGFLIYLFGLYPVSEMWKMVTVGMVLCIIPMIGEWFSVQITLVILFAKRLLHS